MGISNRLFQSDFAQSFVTPCSLLYNMTNFAKSVNLLCMASLWRVLLRKRKLHIIEWSTDTIMVSKIWVGMSFNNIHLLKFKIQGHLQKPGLWMPVHQNSFQSLKCVIFQYFSGHFAFLSKYLNLLAILTIIESTFCAKTIRRVSKWFILAQITQNRAKYVLTHNPFGCRVLKPMVVYSVRIKKIKVVFPRTTRLSVKVLSCPW